MKTLFDAHFHLGAAAGAWGYACTSLPSEWKALASLPARATACIGLLPPHTDITLLREMETLLLAHPTWQIGEVGLDRRFGKRDDQVAFFRRVLELANRTKRILTLHAVRCDFLALSLLDGRIPVIWHGFTGSVETARLATKKGAVISFGERIFRTKTDARLREMRNLPFLLESDAQDSAGYEENLHALYAKMAQKMGMDEKTLEEKVNGARTILTDRQAAWRTGH